VKKVHLEGFGGDEETLDGGEDEGNGG